MDAPLSALVDNVRQDLRYPGYPISGNMQIQQAPVGTDQCPRRSTGRAVADGSTTPVKSLNRDSSGEGAK